MTVPKIQSCLTESMLSYHVEDSTGKLSVTLNREGYLLPCYNHPRKVQHYYGTLVEFDLGGDRVRLPHNWLVLCDFGDRIEPVSVDSLVNVPRYPVVQTLDDRCKSTPRLISIRGQKQLDMEYIIPRYKSDLETSVVCMHQGSKFFWQGWEHSKNRYWGYRIGPVPPVGWMTRLIYVGPPRKISTEQLIRKMQGSR